MIVIIKITKTRAEYEYEGEDDAEKPITFISKYLYNILSKHSGMVAQQSVVM